MKKNPAPCGLRTSMRMLGYSFVFLALVGVREHLTHGSGPVSHQVGKVLNRVLMETSKVGIGLAQMTADAPHQTTTIGSYSRSLDKASRTGFVSAAKMDIYAYAKR
ncbi:MAG: hypothetical protein ACRDBP_08820 [Luteolibacter sp.]